jgi:hypothetical protein
MCPCRFLQRLKKIDQIDLGHPRGRSGGPGFEIGDFRFENERILVTYRLIIIGINV